jgi:hypothetical protein
MFYTRFQTGCVADEYLNSILEIENESISPVCSVRDSYRAVYKLARGDNSLVLTENAANSSVVSSSESLTMTATFLAGWIVFSITFLICLIMATSTLDYDEIGKSTFWEPILAFVVSLTVFRDDNKHSRQVNRIPSLPARFFEGWESCMSALGVNPRRRRARSDYWTKHIPSKSCNPIDLPILGTFLASIIVPIWIIMGIFTVGLLWPPQIRQFLFRSTIRSNSTLRTRAYKERSVLLTKLRDEVHKVKLMSYSRSEGVERELSEIKNILYTAINEE